MMICFVRVFGQGANEKEEEKKEEEMN